MTVSESEESETATSNPLGPSILIIGGTKAGKTHYGGQLLRRLQKQQGGVRMVGMPSDLSAFQEVCDRLAEGKSAPHTPTATYKESIWHVRSNDGAWDTKLVWPDYGGEQVENIVKFRQVPEQWVRRIREAEGWMLFIRLGKVKPPEDILDRPRALEQMRVSVETEETLPQPNQEETSQAGAKESIATSDDSTNNAENSVAITVEEPPDEAIPVPSVALSDQARIVELLQALLFVKQAGTARYLRHPALMIVLSCWDELSLAKREDSTWEWPSELLKKRLPLVSQFVLSNWEPDSLQVLGLSALGKALSDDVGDEEFIDNGPERQGWCILPDGTQSADLTFPIAQLMAKVNAA
jgi:hypothetical protein